MTNMKRILTASLALSCLFSAGLLTGAYFTSQSAIAELRADSAQVGRAYGNLEAADKYLTHCTDTLEAAAIMQESCERRLVTCMGFVKGGIPK